LRAIDRKAGIQDTISSPSGGDVLSTLAGVDPALPSPARHAPRSSARLLAAAALACAAALPPAATATALDPAWVSTAEQMATEAARAAFGTRVPVRVEVIAGQADPRLRLATCQRVEVHWPAGQRPWGRTRIGMRCASGPVAWNITVPLQVRVWAPAVVAAVPMPAGTVLEQRHLRLGEVDWAERDTPVLLDAADILGRSLATAVPAGSAVRAEQLRRRQWFAAGDPVRVVAAGPGFAVSGEGVALTPGLEGQAVRVRTESGRVVTGMAAGDRLVEVSL
jgi:flagella basal body P-ring formation protein FlgA